MDHPCRFKIPKQFLQDNGYTEHCEQCIHYESFGERMAGGAHTDMCRARLMRAMEQSESGGARLAAEQLRMERSEQRARFQGASAPADAKPIQKPTAEEFAMAWFRGRRLRREQSADLVGESQGTSGDVRCETYATAGINRPTGSRLHRMV